MLLRLILTIIQILWISCLAWAQDNTSPELVDLNVKVNIQKTTSDLYDKTLRDCKKGLFTFENMSKSLADMKNMSIETLSAISGDAVQLSNMVKNRGLSNELIEKLNSPDYLKAIEDCTPNNPEYRMLFVLTERFPSYAGRFGGLGLALLAGAAPFVVFAGLDKAVGALPNAYAKKLGGSSVNFLKHAFGAFVALGMYHLLKPLIFPELERKKKIEDIGKAIEFGSLQLVERFKEITQAEINSLENNIKNSPNLSTEEMSKITQRLFVLNKAMDNANALRGKEKTMYERLTSYF